MTMAGLATLHARSFTTPRAWTERELAALVEDPLCFLLLDGPRSAPQGFLIGRSVAGEAELLTLAVAPEARRAGIGKQLVQGFLATARARAAETAFLEVAADNAAAQALYLTQGFAETGRRRGYYQRPDGTRLDALVMACELR